MRITKTGLFLSVFFMSTGLVLARERILWGQLLKGSGATRLAAVTQLSQATEKRETDLMEECEKTGGYSSWSDISYVDLGTIYAYQDFLCLSQPNEDTPALVAVDTTQITDALRPQSESDHERMAAANDR